MMSMTPRPLGQDSPFTRAASILRVTGPEQLDFPRLHAIARETIERMFPDKPAAFVHDHPLPDALAIATDFNLTSVGDLRKLASQFRWR